MPDGSNSPDAPITVYVDGDIQALPFIEDLKRAGLRLVTEGGKTFLRRASQPAETEPTLNEILSGIRLHLNSASGTDIARALELIERAEQVVKRQAAWLKFALSNLDDACALVTLATDAVEHGDDCNSEAALALNDYAWPRMHKGRRAAAFALRTIDPAAVEDMRLEVAWDNEERERIDRIEAMYEKYD